MFPTSAGLPVLLWLAVAAFPFPRDVRQSIGIYGAKASAPLERNAAASVGPCSFLGREPLLALIAALLYPLAISLTGQHFGTGMAVAVVTTGAGIDSFSFPFVMSAPAEGFEAVLFLFAATNAALVLLCAVILRAARLRLAPRSARRPASGRQLGSP